MNTPRATSKTTLVSEVKRKEEKETPVSRTTIQEEPIQKERKKQKRSTVAVVGLGYVGLPLILLGEQKGYTPIGIEIDEKKISSINNRSAQYITDDEKKLLAKSTLRASNDPKMLAEADIVVICVPTPVSEKNYMPDLEPLRHASAMVGEHMKNGALIIVESTINPGVCEEVVIPLLSSMSKKRVNQDFLFAHCPERINPGDSTWAIRTIPRVIGGSSKESLEEARVFYESILDAQVHAMESLREAEAVKMVENSFRDINIAFVNEMAMSFAKLNIDVVNVIKGASTKPFSFMPHYPGCGVGGHCIPVDPYYLIAYAAENGFTHRFLTTARDINNNMPVYTVDLLLSTLEEAELIWKKSITVALLGLAYKRDIGDIRESPALHIREELQDRGFDVITFDPHIPEESTVPSLDAALAVADVVIIATDHKECASLTPEQCIRYGIKVVIDGRNCLDKQAFLQNGIIYRGIGR